MSSLLEGVDVSVYQGAINLASWEALYASGQRVAVVGSAHPRPNIYALQNLDNAKKAGFILATYLALYPGVTGGGTVQTAKNQCGPFWPELTFVAVDCEVDGITEQQINDAIAAVKTEGKRPVIYTAYWWWHDHFGDNRNFNTYPLWNAYYDQNPDVDFTSLPYGGWPLENVMGEQYSGTTILAGTTVDRNSFKSEFFTQGDPNMEEIAKLKALNKVAELFNSAVGYALKGLIMPESLRSQLRYLLG